MTDPTATAMPTSTTLHRRTWTAGSHDIVICLHGLESHADWFDDFAAAINKRGLDVLAYDRGGFGRSAGLPGDARSVAALMAELQTICHDLGRYRRKHLVGLSWGGVLAVTAAGELAGQFSSVSLISPALFYKRRLSPVRFLLAIASYVSGGLFTVPLPIKADDFTANHAHIAYIERDPFRTRAVTGRFLWLTLLLQRRARRWLQVSQKLPPVQIFLAGIEPLVDNAAIKQLINGTNITLKEWPQCRHSLVFEAPDDIAAAVADLVLAAGQA